MECYKMVTIRPIFILSTNICSINSALYNCQKCFKSSTFNNALLEKRGHIILHLSIGLSVGPQIKRCHLNIFLPLCLKVFKLGTVVSSRKQMTTNYFEVTWSKVKVKLLVFEKLFGQSFLIPSLESSLTWYTGCTQQIHVQITWSKVKVKLLVLIISTV